MEYYSLKHINTPLSALTYGTGSEVVSGKDTGQAYDCLELAYANGFTTFDSANAYGNAESNLGSFIYNKGIRDKTVILDKGCNPGMKGSNDVFIPSTIRNQVEESLNRLKTDYIDIYVLHRDDPSKDCGPIIEVLNELKDTGTIKSFGVSNWSLGRIKEADEYAKSRGLTGIELISPCYSLARFINDPWGGSVVLSGDENKDFREYVKKNGISVFNYSPLARGFLSGKYKTYENRPIEKCLWWGTVEEYSSPENIDRLKRAEELAGQKGCTVSQICLAYVLSNSLNMHPIVSPTKESHMKDNIGAFNILLTGEEAEWLWRG